MRAGSHKTQSLIITIVMASGVLGYLAFVFVPAQKSIGRLRRELSDKRQFIIDAEDRYTELDALDQELRRVRGEFQSSRSSARGPLTLANLLRTVTQLAAGNELALRRISPSEPRDRAHLRQHDLELVVEGRFSPLFEFLRRLESWPGNVWTTHLTLERNGEDGEDLTCKLNLTIFSDLPDSSD